MELSKQLRDESGPTGVTRLLADHALLNSHLSMLPAPRRPGLDPFDPTLLIGLAKLEEAQSLPEALRLLTPRERAASLADVRGVQRLVALATGAAE